MKMNDNIDLSPESGTESQNTDNKDCDNNFEDVQGTPDVQDTLDVQGTHEEPLRRLN